MPRYHVPKATVRVETRVSNSRFISTIERTDTVAAAQAFIKSQREEMPDANHHVYAFRIGFGNSVSEGMSDDGEPSGTSGPRFQYRRCRDRHDALLRRHQTRYRRPGRSLYRRRPSRIQRATNRGKGRTHSMQPHRSL